MSKLSRPAVIAGLAALLCGGSIAAARADSPTPSGIIQLAQMNSPGDGLDGRRAVREGNARPYRMGSMGYGRLNRYRYGWRRYRRRYW